MKVFYIYKDGESNLMTSTNYLNDHNIQSVRNTDTLDIQLALVYRENMQLSMNRLVYIYQNTLGRIVTEYTHIRTYVHICMCVSDLSNL